MNSRNVTSVLSFFLLLQAVPGCSHAPEAAPPAAAGAVPHAVVAFGVPADALETAPPPRTGRYGEVPVPIRDARRGWGSAAPR
jgi:hypothetical protein